MKKFFILILLCFAVHLQAQFQENIASSRPGNAYGTFAVGTNFLQLESGLDFMPRQKKYVHNTFFRYGIAKGIEFNTNISYDYSTENAGFNSLFLGTKINLSEAKVSSGLFLGTTIANRELVNSTATALYLFAYPLTNKLTATINLGTTIDLEKGTNTSLYYEGVYVCNFSYSLSDVVSVFVEPYGVVEKFNTINFNVNSGLGYLVNSNLQLDGLLSYAASTTKDLSYSIGVSWRFSLKK